MKKMFNSYIVKNGIAYVDVSTPKHPKAVTLIDVADMPLVLKGRRWCACCPNKGYTLRVSRRRPTANGRETSEWLHRLILGLKSRKIFSDHIDRDGLNNRRSNLRACTPRNNQGNRIKNRNSKNPFKGASLDRRTGNWYAQIHKNGKHIHLGIFKTAKEAAIAYDEAARKSFGEFARLNFGEMT